MRWAVLSAGAQGATQKEQVRRGDRDVCALRRERLLRNKLRLCRLVRPAAKKVKPLATKPIRCERAVFLAPAERLSEASV